MPSPVYSAGAPGNLIAPASVTHGITIAAFLDLSACIEGQVLCEMTVGSGSAPTLGTTFSAYKVYGNSTTNTLSSSVTAGTSSTSLSVASKTGMNLGQKIAIQKGGTSPQVGEIVTIGGAITGSGPYAVPITGLGSNSGTLYSYSSGDAVYLIEQTATAVAQPGASTGGWSINTDYSKAMYLGTAQYVIAAANTDTSIAITAAASVDKITGYV